MLRIAVATDKGIVADHFGHCESFMIFDTENKQIIKSETVANPGHKPGFLPNFLADRGVNNYQRRYGRRRSTDFQ